MQSKPIQVNTVKELLKEISTKKPALILLSGAPGSGKSTLAKTIAAQLSNCDHFEADQYFETSSGYKFNANKLGIAHQQCQDNVRNSIEEGRCVIVANTFSMDWELEPYIKMTKNFILIQLTGDHGNIHGCPEHTVANIRDRIKMRRFQPTIICNNNINKN